MADYGLAALSGILGGLGGGALHGYDAAMADQQKAAQLAEQKRQFDESKVIDLGSLPPELKTALGLPAAVGKVPTALAPTALNAAKEARAQQTLAEKNANLGSALEQ